MRLAEKRCWQISGKGVELKEKAGEYVVVGGKVTGVRRKDCYRLMLKPPRDPSLIFATRMLLVEGLLHELQTLSTTEESYRFSI